MLFVILAMLGLIIGSFVNAATWRLKSGESIIRGRSMCPNCRHQLRARDLLPVFSWLALKGRCRYCNKPYGAHYLVVELKTGLLFALNGLLLPELGLVAFGLWLAILTCLMILALYDWQWYELPDAVMNPALVLGLVYFVLRFTAGSGLVQLAAALAAAGVFYAAWWLSQGKLMGGADSKLVLLMGLILVPTQLIMALALGFMLAGLGAGWLLAHKKKGLQDQMPFGPYLIAGLLIILLFGPR